MKNKFQSKSVPRGTRTIWRYLSAFILLFSLSIGQMWAATETTPSSNGTNNADLVGTSYTIPGACNPKGINAVGTYTGVKMRTNQAATVNGESVSNCWYMNINSGYKITAATFYMTYNSSAETIKNIYVDDALYSSPNEALAAKGGTPNVFAITGINATKQIVFEGTNAQQIFLYATFTYEAVGGGGSDPTDTYSITYNCDGATSGCPGNVASATALPSTLPTPVKTGNNFGGWFTDSEKTVKAVAGAALSADANLYAKWYPVGLPLTAFSKGTVNLGTTQWSVTTKNATIYEDNNRIMLYSQGNALNVNANYLQIGNSSKASALVFRVAEACDLEITVGYNGTDATMALYYLGTTTDELATNNFATGTLCDTKEVTSSSGDKTLVKQNAAAGYYKVHGSVRFLAKSITIADPTSTCTDPVTDATFAADATEIEIAYGDANVSTNLTFTKGSNTSNPTYVVTKGGSATSDASVSAGVFTATAEGTYKVTATQAADGTYCEVVKEVTITVTEEAAPAPEEVDGIKMVANGELTGNFVTSSTLTALSGTDKYTIEGIDYTKYLKFNGSFSGSYSSGARNNYLMYDLRTANTTFYLYVHNNASSAYKIIVYTYAEGGANTKKAEIEVAANADAIKSFEMNDISANTRVFIGVNNNSNLYLCQVVAVESGAALKKGGEIGYSAQFNGSNKSRFSAASGTAILMDSIEYVTSSGFAPNSGTEVALGALGTNYVKFKLPVRTKVKVTTNSTNKYYIGTTIDPEAATSKTYEFKPDASNTEHGFNLNAGTYYLNPDASNIKLTKLAFDTPDAAYAVTYSAGTGSVKDGKSLPTQADAVAGEKFNLASGENLERSGYDFKGWKANGTGDLLLAGAEYTMGSAAVEFVAQWDVHVAKYGVKFMDGATKLDSLSVTLGEAPVFANPTKALYTFAGWKDGEDNDVTLSSLAESVTVENTVIVLYAQWEKAYAQSVDIEDYALNTSTNLDNFKAWFSGKGYSYANLNGMDKTTDNNGAYAGVKTKSADAYYEFRVVANKRVTIKLGYMASAAEMYINGVKNESQALTGGSTSSGNDNYANWNYDIAEESVFKLQMKTGSTCVLKAITIGDIPAKSDDATLSNLTLKYGTDDPVTISGFAVSKEDYYVELPYGTTTAPTVAGTATDTKAISVTPVQAESLPGNATVTVLAENNTTTKTYTVYFTVAPKLGVELIKATHTGTKSASKAGYWAEDVAVDKDTQSKKMGANDNYFGLTLSGSKKFMNGDLLCIYLDPNETESQWLQVFKDKGDNIIIDKQSGVTKGANYFTLSDLPEGGIDKLYLYRTSTAGGKMNPYVDYIAVYREMPSFFESFTVAGVAATIDETVTPKTITVEVPAVTEITALTPTYKAWANGGATVSPTTAQDFSAGAIDYTVTSAYEETTTYKVTVTKAAAIKEVVISGTLTVKEDETTALSAVVYDTNDQEASIQDVTWSVKSGDEGLASVDANGVVTGKNAGTAHIIATSVADGDISAQVAVEVTENLCRTWTNPTAVNEVRTLGKMKVTPESISELKEDAIPYQGASATKAWKLDARDTRYAEVNFTDNAQFESLTIGVTSNGSSKNYQFAVAFSTKAGNKFAEGFISAAAYEANDKDEAESLVDVVIPTGTKVVRILRQYRDGSTDIGGSSSVYLYYINACKKELVALTSVAVADKSLAVGVVGVPAVTLTPATADVASYAWEIVSDATGAATINAATGAISSTATGAVTVKVTATDELSHVVESNIATINIVNKYDAVTPVTGTTTWSWDALDLTGYDANGPTIADPDTVLANYFSGIEWQQLAGGVGGRPYRNTTDYKCYQGYTLYFETTVPGKLKMYASRISNQQKVYVNGIEVGEFTSSGKIYLNEIVVPAGPVYITAGTNGMRIYNMTFDTNLDPTQAEESFLEGYERDVTAGRYGTICLPNGGVMVGAAIFEIAYFDIPSSKIYFDEVLNGTMEAGMPYIFLPNENVSRLGVYYTDAADAAAGNNNGLYGSYDQVALDTDGSNYILLNNQYCRVVNANTYVGANRAYIKLNQVPDYPTAAPAPGRRRISMGVQGTNTATGIDAINASEQPMKIMIDGQMYILRGEKMYDATGRLVK